MSGEAKENGLYTLGKTAERRYPFCIHEDHAVEDLFPAIRKEALGYFQENGIPWHEGHTEMPSTHLCESKVCCVNFLFPFSRNPEALVPLLRNLFLGFKSAIPTEERRPPSSLSFKWIGL